MIRLTENGYVQGLQENQNVSAYLGIPYAKPPVEDLRWKPPVISASWIGVRSANSFSKRCMQPYAKADAISEDCLYLNVWTPTQGNSEDLPVMVWIHGGGFWGGSGSDPDNQGAILARQHVVVVTINYRLGVFGFLGHHELSQESQNQVSGNYGILDQIAALQWVQRNIHNFGGNPHNVTIVGESAGGESVADLMASPLAQGLFHSAIAQSGYDIDDMRLLKDDSHGRSLESIGNTVAKTLECNTSQKAIDCMRRLPALEVLQKTALDQLGMEQLSPVVDGYVLRKSPSEIFEEGTQVNVPIIIGIMKNEMMNNPSLKTVNSISKYKAYLSKCFPKNFSEIFNLYPVHGPKEIFIQLERLGTDMRATRFARTMARQMSKIQSQVFLFKFSHVPPFSEKQGLGAFHSLDVSYVFQTGMTKPRFEDLDFKISDEMQRRWAGFSKSGNPGDEWSPFSANAENYLEIGNQFINRSGLEDRKLDLLDRAIYGSCYIQ